MKPYPKHLLGPSALGSAQARALEQRGGEFQWSQRDASTTVKKQGQFSKVLVSGAEYVTEGFLNPTDKVHVAALYHQMPFTPTAANPQPLHLGDGRYFGFRKGPFTSFTLPYTYTLYPGRDQTVYTYRAQRTAQGFFSLFLGGDNFKGEFEHSHTDVLTGTTIDFGFDDLGVALERPLSSQVRAGLVLAATTIENGREDVAGRPLEDPALFLFPVSGDASGLPLDPSAFTRPEAEFHPHMPSISTSGDSVVFMREKFFFTEEFNGAKDYVPKFWMVRAAGKNFASLSVFNLTNQLFDDSYMESLAANPLTISAPAEVPPVDGFSALSGAYENSLESDTMASMRLVALPGNVILMAYHAYCIGSLINPVTGLPYNSEFRLRIAKITLGPGTATAEVKFERPVLFTLSPSIVNRYPAQYIKDMIYLGNGIVLARIVRGLGPSFGNLTGLDYDVEWIRSVDGGENWSSITPTGFSAPAKNQFYGDMILHRPANDSSLGVVLCVSWDTDAYFVYASLDAGETWQRRGMVGKPSQFFRIDTNIALQLSGTYLSNADSYSGCFDQLIPGSDISRPADLTMPDRYGS